MRVTIATVGALARLQLEARRAGLELQLGDAPDELHALIALVGLEGVLPVKSKRQAEQREERGRIEEEGELGDPTT
jgi:hypothetical protein